MGDWVFLKLHPFQQQSIRSTIQTKLSSKYYGPFLVMEKVGNLAYKLDLPARSLVHPILNISLYSFVMHEFELKHTPLLLIASKMPKTEGK